MSKSKGRRRSKGEGSTFKRRDGRWVSTLPGVKDKPYYGTTEAESQAKRDAALRRQQDGIDPKSKRVTFEVFAGEWLADQVHTVKPRTHESYAGILRKHLLPDLGHILITELEDSDIQRCYNRRLSAGTAAKTVRNCNGVLYSILERAVKRRLVAKNSATLVDLPRVIRREMVILSEAEARQLMEVAADHRLGAFFIIALCSGARLGELAGMEWSRIDIKKKVMRITHTLEETPVGFQLSEPKTAQSVRENELPQMAIDALRRHQVNQNKEALRLGPAWSNDLNLVFTSQDGQPLRRRRILRQELRPIARKAGLPTASSLRTHDLRHTAISLLLNRGLPIPLVSAYVGHSSPDITMKIYAHAVPSSQHEIADAAQAMFATDGL